MEESKLPSRVRDLSCPFPSAVTRKGFSKSWLGNPYTPPGLW